MRRKNQQPYKNFGSGMGISSFKYIWKRNDTEENARMLQCQGETTLNLHHHPKILRRHGQKEKTVRPG